MMAALLLASQALAETDETTGLVIAPGWQQVRAHCGGCHSHALVTQQRADGEHDVGADEVQCPEYAG